MEHLISLWQKCLGSPVAISVFGSVYVCVCVLQGSGRKKIKSSPSVVEVIHIYLLNLPISSKILSFLIKLSHYKKLHLFVFESCLTKAPLVFSRVEKRQSLAYKKLRWGCTILTVS